MLTLLLSMAGPYKYVFVAGILVLSHGISYFFGWRGAHDALVQYRTSIEVIAKRQAEEVKQTELDHDRQTKAVAEIYSDDRARLLANLSRLRKQSNGSGTLPRDAINPQGTNAATSEQRGTCEGTEFYTNALSDVLQLKAWQEWAIRQRIPVK